MTRDAELREIEAAIAGGKLHRISLAEAQAYNGAAEYRRDRGVSPLIPPAPSCRTPRG